jgi:hypothetical protein
MSTGPTAANRSYAKCFILYNKTMRNRTANASNSSAPPADATCALDRFEGCGVCFPCPDFACPCMQWFESEYPDTLPPLGPPMLYNAAVYFVLICVVMRVLHGSQYHPLRVPFWLASMQWQPRWLFRYVAPTLSIAAIVLTLLPALQLSVWGRTMYWIVFPYYGSDGDTIGAPRIQDNTDQHMMSTVIVCVVGSTSLAFYGVMAWSEGSWRMTPRVLLALVYSFNLLGVVFFLYFFFQYWQKPEVREGCNEMKGGGGAERPPKRAAKGQTC